MDGMIYIMVIGYVITMVIVLYIYWKPHSPISKMLTGYLIIIAIFTLYNGMPDNPRTSANMI